MTIDEVIAHARENYNDIINTTYNKCQYEHLSCEGCATPTCKEIADENLQIAEWLKELKDYRDKNKMVVRVDVENMDSIKDKIDELSRYAESQYNKALDDFVEKISESNKGHWRPTRYEHGEVVSETMSYDIGTIRLIAEQLKAGGENG